MSLGGAPHTGQSTVRRKWKGRREPGLQASELCRGSVSSTGPAQWSAGPSRPKDHLGCLLFTTTYSIQRVFKASICAATDSTRELCVILNLHILVSPFGRHYRIVKLATICLKLTCLFTNIAIEITSRFCTLILMDFSPGWYQI